MTAAAALAAMDSLQFYEQLVGDLTARREALSEAEKSFGGFAPLGREELIEWPAVPVLVRARGGWLYRLLAA